MVIFLCWKEKALKKTHQKEEGTNCNPANSPVPAWGRAQHFFHIIAKLGDACGDKWEERGDSRSKFFLSRCSTLQQVNSESITEDHFVPITLNLIKSLIILNYTSCYF